MPSAGSHESGRFHTTCWSLVVAAAKLPGVSADAALAKLCQLYWYPIYAFVRRRGYAQEDAKDLTQEFFSRVLEKNYLEDADPSRGRFRSFLLAAVRHFLANEWNRQRTQKRGGGMLTIELDSQTAEGRYRAEPADPENPEKLYERQWALALLDQVMASLREKYVLDGRLDDFEKLSPLLTGTAQLPYANLAQQWNTSEGAVKVAVHRIRKRYRALLRQKIGETVIDPADIDDEIRFLISSLELSK
jgi:RNA polymerase sigma-70 factor (ECF subfamily)